VSRIVHDRVFSRLRYEPEQRSVSAQPLAKFGAGQLLLRIVSKLPLSSAVTQLGTKLDLFDREFRSLRGAEDAIDNPLMENHFSFGHRKTPR
jgi:hypothetical protein